MRVQGSVSKIRFHSDASGWTVFVLDTEDGALTCVGDFVKIEEGEAWCLDGELLFHDRYGEQLRVRSAQKLEPKTEAQLERYLSSGLIPHIGAKTAKKLVKLFGTEVLRVLAEDEHALLQIRGIGRTKAQAIQKAVREQQATRELAIFFQDLHIGPKLAAEIYQRYGMQTQAILRENPYRLIEEISGVGFRTADRIAQQNGLAADSVFRCKAALVYWMEQEALSAGNCFLSRAELEQEIQKLLGANLTHFDEALFELQINGTLYEEPHSGRWYLNSIYRLENEVASRVCRLLDVERTAEELTVDMERIEQKMKLHLSERQKSAVMQAAAHSVLVITGGPGTGKTTILRAILEVFDENRLATVLAAPTGRAAKRMEQSTGRSAQTIHRLLGFKGGSDSKGRLLIEHDEDNPLSCDAVVIDEASMMDLFLMGSLMQALPPEARLIFVGDVDQLPSVGPGNVLRDLIDSKQVPTIALDTIYRQSGASLIVTNAHRINHGAEPILNRGDQDFFFLPGKDSMNTLELVEDLVCRRLPEHYGLEPGKDIQVLAPTKKGTCGVENLNGLLQRALNPAQGDVEEIESGTQMFRAGDRVMQTQNDYRLPWTAEDGSEGEGVYNGDFGIVREVNSEEGSLCVDFEGRLAWCDAEQIQALVHSYAITIHKSQGSEFPCVVLPLTPGPSMLLTRNILYTAITRARKLVVLAGSREVLRQMIRNNSVRRRNSSLAERIVSYRAVYSEDGHGAIQQ
ncbi:MAG: ATP-dependent RecD-like DNA helicase [Ndongobacter sp.]|nr:ATP-dependent RecD-like DNA helicase [Ndongobacter sp.]